MVRESAECQNQMEICSAFIGEISQKANKVLLIYRSGIMMVSMVGAVSLLSPWILLVLRGTLPSFFSLIYSMKNAIRADQELGARNRVRGYYAELMTEVAYAKELKAYGLYPVLIDRWDQESSFINRERLLLEKKNAVRRLVLLHMQKADVSDDQIIRALERVGLSGLLKELGYDLDIPLGKLFEDGRELSGGQWQRVALARALLGDSEYIFLDEPTGTVKLVQL